MTASRWLCPLLLLPLLLSARCGSAYHLPPRPTRKLQPPVVLPEGIRRLEVQFHEGLLTLAPGDELTCELEIDLLAEGQDQLDELEARIEPFVEPVEPDAARLCVALPTGADLDAVRTTWRLTAPRDVELVVHTRRGSVVARGAQGPLVVHGGSGVIDARMDGGRAVLSTKSGSLMLRGDFPNADVGSEVGRIDVQLPADPVGLVDLAVRNGEGNVYLEVHRGQQYYLFFHGQEHQVRTDPEVRVSWELIVPEGSSEQETLQGKLGDMAAQPLGQIELRTRGTVFVRMRPETAGR